MIGGPVLIVGPLASLLIATLAVAAFIAWLRRYRRYPGPRLLTEQPDIDHGELEAAEREVRGMASRAPDEPVAGRDWRPGVPRPPERL
jgi:hypothetical protein